MKFIAYLLIAANVALAAYYISTKSPSTNKTQSITTAKLSNLAYSDSQVSKPVEKPKPVEPKPVAAKPQIDQETSPVKPEESSVCLEISQISEPTTVTSIQSILNKNQITHEIREEDTVIKTVYYIFIGPFTSDKRTKLEIKNLKEDKIDYYVLPNGEDKGAISLGLYSNKKSAEGEVNKFVKKDYDARLEEKDIYKTLFFIDIPASSSQKLSSEIWDEILKSDSVVKKSEISC